MSLTARLSNLFSQDNSSGDSSQSQRNGYATPEFDLDGARQVKRQRTMEGLADEDIDIELKRPPYLHVCGSCSVESFSGLLTCAVDACRRNRRDYGRHSHALVGYCQDEAARRSSLPTEIFQSFRFLHQDFPARRDQKRPLWRVYSSHAGLFPRDRHLLRVV